MSFIHRSKLNFSPPDLSLQQAVDEAHRCLLCHDAPCSGACPGSTDPGIFIRQIRLFNLKGAARTIIKNNPLAEVCACICPTEDTCVKACLRVGLDRPINIAGLQRFAAKYGREQGVKVLHDGPSRTEKIAIIGAGPAGLAAAAHLANYGFQITIFESSDKPGGMLYYGIPKDRLPKETFEAEIKEILSLKNIELRLNEEIDQTNGAQKLLQEGYDAVFVSTGLWKPYQLDIKGIESEGVTNAISFLAKVNTESQKAKDFVQNKNVVVIGGGSVAMDAALCAQSLGADKIYIMALEAITEFPALDKEIGQALSENIVIKPQSKLTKIVQKGEKLVGIEGIETQWIKPDNFAPSNAKEILGTEFKLRVDVLITAIGQGPTEVASNLVPSNFKLGQYIKADSQKQFTADKKIFTGGDIARGPATVVEAIGDGARAAIGIYELLTNEKAVKQ